MDMQAVNAFLEHLGREGTALLQPIVAVGVLTMAIIQTVKDLVPIRRWFQQGYVHRWLAAKARRVDARVPDAERTLVRLATAGDARALYDLPIEQLCGQMSAAARVVVDFPRRYRDLLACLAAEADREDVDLIVEVWERLSAERARASGAEAAPAGALPVEVIDARTRVLNQVQRSIDGLQIAAGTRWKLWQQTAAFILSFAVTALAASSGAAPRSSAILFGLAGGFLAPVAHDLLTALQSLRPDARRS